jgi:hypothetical protein
VTVAGETTFHVGIEAEAILERAVTGEDAVRVLGREFAARIRVPGLQHHGTTLR